MNAGISGLSAKTKRAYLLIGSLAFVLISAFFTYLQPLNNVDYIVSDFFYRTILGEAKESDSNIKIIAVDEKTVDAFGNFESWSRSEAAALLDTLNGEGAPDVVAFGLDCHDSKDEEGDEKFAAACAKYGNVCASAYASTKEAPDAPAATLPTVKSAADGKNDGKMRSYNGRLADIPKNTIGGDKITNIRFPYEELLPYVRVGIMNTSRNADDGYARNVIAGVNYKDVDYDSFAVAVYKMYYDARGKEYDIPAVDDRNMFGINYTRNNSEYDVYSFYDVVNGEVDPDEFKDGIVLVGDYTEGGTFNVPNGGGAQIREIELQANIINALINDNTILFAKKWFLAIWYSIFAVLFFIGTSYSSRIGTLLYAVFLIALQVLSNGFLNFRGIYIPLLRFIILIVAIAVVNLVASYVVLNRNKSSLEDVFKKYVDEQVVNEIVKTGGMNTSIGGIRKDIAVLFVDIRGFTSLSENLAPEYVVDILNSYLTIIANAVSKNGGTLDKFIGDAAMAVFNSPADLDDYVFRCVCTAWEIISGAEDLMAECLEKYDVEVAFGIGIHCGDAVIGNIGSQTRMDYTAIGDTVNTASRLEGAAERGQVLISDEVMYRLGDRIETAFSDELKLKGKKNKVAAYELTGINDVITPVEKENVIEDIYKKGLEEAEKIRKKGNRGVKELKRIRRRAKRELRALNGRRDGRVYGMKERGN